jgi:hypothetical protein
VNYCRPPASEMQSPVRSGYRPGVAVMTTALTVDRLILAAFARFARASPVRRHCHRERRFARRSRICHRAASPAGVSGRQPASSRHTYLHSSAIWKLARSKVRDSPDYAPRHLHASAGGHLQLRPGVRGSSVNRILRDPPVAAWLRVTCSISEMDRFIHEIILAKRRGNPSRQTYPSLARSR